jgi:ankyrin repeat protein
VTPDLFLDAVKRGDEAAVRDALGADPALAGSRDDGVSAVLTALYRGARGVADAILEARPRLDAFDAAAVGDAAALRDALARDPGAARAHGADGFTALQLAAFFGRPEAAAALLAAGADVNAVSRGGLRTTPLLAALAGPAPSMAFGLLEAGADVHARGDGGFTPLHSAAQGGHDAEAAALLERGADPAARADDGRTPLDLARAHGRDALVARLEAAAAR